MRLPTVRYPLGACTLICLVLFAQTARAQTFRYEAEPRAGDAGFAFADADPAPKMTAPVVARRVSQRPPVAPQSEQPLGRRLASRSRQDRLARESRVTSNDRFLRPAVATEPIPTGQPLDPFGEELPPGGPVHGDPAPQMEFEGGTLEPEVMNQPFLQQPTGEFIPDGYCNGGDCYQGRYCLLRRWWWHVSCLRRNGAYCENFSLAAGVHGFKGPVDLGMNGNFGYHGGGTWAFPLLEAHGIGYQIGVNYLGSDFAGQTGPLGHRRSQLFATTGVFRRALCGQGFQGGAVLDYLRDDFYIQMDLTQVRAELSYQYNYHEFGFWGAFQGNTSTHWGQIPGQPFQTYSYQANSQYNLFYRYEFCNGSFARAWAGLSGHGDGILGGDATMRISNKLGVLANYNYLIPRNDPTVPNNVKESWNLTISLVWYPGYNRCDSWKNPYRPLFYTADNGWFFTRQANE